MAHTTKTAPKTTLPIPTDAPIDTIPGLGPIRIRALRKAGLQSTSELRSLSLAELSAVPGITEQFASKIMDYVSAYAASESKTTDMACERFANAGRDVDALINNLLRFEQAGDYSAKFARQLGKMAVFTERNTSVCSIDNERAEKAAEQMRDVARLLTEASTGGHITQKRQDKLAEELQTKRKKMRLLIEKSGKQ